MGIESPVLMLAVVAFQPPTDVGCPHTLNSLRSLPVQEHLPNHGADQQDMKPKGQNQL